MTSSADSDRSSSRGESRPAEQAARGSVPDASNALDWRRRYTRILALSDLVVVAVVVYGTQFVWLGFGDDVTIRADARIAEFPYWLFSAGLILVWAWALTISDSRTDRVIGTGSVEYVRVVRASFNVFAVLTIIAFLTRVDVARGYLLISLPAGVGLLVLSRWVWRRWLVAKRIRGLYVARIVLIGSEVSIAHIASELARNPGSGYEVVGACSPTSRRTGKVKGTNVQYLGSVDDLSVAMASTGADTVAVTGTGEMSPLKLKQISWSLKPGKQHLVLAPSMTDIAGPRVQTRPVAGLPLIHVETPRFSRGQRIGKRVMDVFLTSVGLVVISPLVLVIALMVKLDSPGPVLFSQTRVGRRGREFKMWKFRSMVQNAEDLLPSLLDKRDRGNEVLFKMNNDPRVTRVGHFIRRYSLDELPQLINVLNGTMSLVGPRPPLRSEVDQYADHVHRRFLMKPGITGAWQVGGRSALSWEDSVRLDLSYVENWSMLGDLVILGKTARAALLPGNTAS